MMKDWLKNIAGIYIVWILIHYLSPHLYVYFCVPATAMGFLTSAIYAPTPHCRALRWAIYQGGEMIMTMWIVAGSWVVKRLALSNDEDKPTHYVNPERKSPPIHM